VALSPGEGSIIFAADPTGHYKTGIYVLTAGETRQLTDPNGRYSDGSPVWSPDGQKIAFASNREHGLPNIYLMNADGTEQRKLTDFELGADCPSWSPDANRIAFTGWTELVKGVWELDVFVVNVDGSGLTNLTNTREDEQSPAWSPDGERIAFDCGEGICVMNAEGNDRGVIAPDSSGRSNSSPAWSPDGQRIAFHSYIEGTDWQIYLIDSDGANLTRLTHLGLYGVSDPVWSPDGKKIAFQDDEFIYVLDLESGIVTKLVPGQNPDWHE
jgi:Tol biopolymer transport system component